MQLMLSISYAGAYICCNYAVFEVLFQLCWSYFLVDSCWWIFLLQLSRWPFLLQLYSQKFLQHLCRWKFLQQIFGWQFLLKLCRSLSLQGVSVAIMEVVFSTVHYAHDYFYCSYAGDCFCCSYVLTVSSSNFIFLSLTDAHFS